MFALSPLDTLTVLHFYLYRAEKTEVLSEDLLQVSCVCVCVCVCVYVSRDGNQDTCKPGAGLLAVSPVIIHAVLH